MTHCHHLMQLHLVAMLLQMITLLKIHTGSTDLCETQEKTAQFSLQEGHSYQQEIECQPGKDFLNLKSVYLLSFNQNLTNYTNTASSTAFFGRFLRDKIYWKHLYQETSQ